MRGFGRMDVVGVLLILAIVALLGVGIVPAMGRPRIHPTIVKEGAQVREITRAIGNWASATGEPFPLPMLMSRDASDHGDWSLNTTGRIYSMLVGMELVSSDVLVSAAELNPRIRPFGQFVGGDYVPSGMSDRGPWFDAFSADLASRNESNTSFAHMEPTRTRIQRLRDEGGARFPLVSLRFPRVEGPRVRTDGTIATPFGDAESYPILMHTPRSRWIGNVGYADGHVEIAHEWLDRGITDPASIPWTYRTTDGRLSPDVPWLDDEDDAGGSNHFLGVFTRAGRDRGDFVAVYD